MKKFNRVKDTVESVMERLTEIHHMYYDTIDKDTIDYPKMCNHFGYAKYQVEEYLAKGWYGNEIVAFLQHLKEVNPHQPAELAIANMTSIRDMVCRRFGLPLTTRQM